MSWSNGDKFHRILGGVNMKSVNYKNTKPHNNIMKKLNIFILMIFLCITSVSAVSVNLNQDDVISDFYNNDKGNHYIDTIVGSANYILSTINATENRTYDYDLEFAEASESFYIIVKNGLANKSMQLMWYGDLTRDNTLYVQNLTFNEYGNYMFKVIPSYDGEPITVLMDLEEDSYVVDFEIVEEKPKGFNLLMTPLVSGFVDIIDINIGMWNIAFYSIIALVTFGFIALLFSIAFLIFAYTRKLQGRPLIKGGEESDS